ncbi:MAG: C40 family peptidase [Bacteroidota bacterium]|nr:C40 family peptidase [Bacteroidota bacterium]MDX5427021.1 C40 family peptidase [Bacteroidota bacterium]MDX5448458.1 C40 family peptidase [Bacteroidota bacterium]MDX5505001.1 C40 family peptidase [Bacteroidota bacterium]
MEYGICPLSIVPMRAEPDDRSELVNQALFADVFKVVEKRTKWVRIRLSHDKYEGWIDRKQYREIEEGQYKEIAGIKHSPMVMVPVDMLTDPEDPFGHIMVVQGTSLPTLENGRIALPGMTHLYNGETLREPQPKSRLVDFAYSYLNAPYLWGGRTPFGIDCSGFTQMVYKMGGYRLLRDASQQATQGVALSFIEESEPGDLAFFDNQEGKIIHVGIILEDNYILHASGKVRLDRLDQSGIYNPELRTHTHRLRVIKKIF